MGAPYHIQLDQQIIARYRREVKDGEIDLREVASWAIREGLWEPPFKSQIEQLYRELAAAMRAQTFTDPKGRKVRSNYCVRQEATKPNGQKYTQAIWSHIDVATHPFMVKVFSQRRQGIAGIAVQAAIDAEHWNEFRRGDNEAIQLHLDFRDDAADAMHSTNYQPSIPTDGISDIETL